MKNNRYLEKDSRGRILVAFGKYAGEYLMDVASADSRYLNWILQENEDLPDDVREEIEKALT